MLLSCRTGETFAAIQESSDQFLGQRRSLLAPRLSRRCQNHLLRRHGLGVELEHHLLDFSGVNGREKDIADITVLVGFPYGNDNNGLTVFVCLLGILNGRSENVDKWWKSYIEPAIGLWEEGKGICI